MSKAFRLRVGWFRVFGEVAPASPSYRVYLTERVVTFSREPVLVFFAFLLALRSVCGVEVRLASFGDSLPAPSPPYLNPGYGYLSPE